MRPKKMILSQQALTRWPKGEKRRAAQAGSREQRPKPGRGRSPDRCRKGEKPPCATSSEGRGNSARQGTMGRDSPQHPGGREKALHQVQREPLQGNLLNTSGLIQQPNCIILCKAIQKMTGGNHVTSGGPKHYTQQSMYI